MQLPLTNKLLSILTITLGLVMAPFVAMRYEHVADELQKEAENTFKESAVRVAEAVKPSVWNEYISPEEVKYSAAVTAAILKSEMVTNRLIGISVKDPFHQRYLGFYKLEDGTIIELPDPQTMPLPQHGEKHYIYPIMDNGIRIGETEIIYSDANIDSALQRTLSLELVHLMIVTLVAIALLYAALRQALLKPIQSLQIAQKTIDSMSEAVLVIDDKFLITNVNMAYEAMSGEPESDLVHRRPDLYVETGGTLQPLWKVVGSLGKWSGEVTVMTASGSRVSAWVRFSEVIQQDQSVCYVGVVTDITEKKEAEQQLHQMAYFDALTALPNRTYFMETLNREIEDSKRHSKRLGLLFIDLDNFKVINDSYGHSAGDLFLQTIASRFKDRLRKSDYLFRLSGDEFTVVTTDVGDEHHLEILANDLIQIATMDVKLDVGKTVSAGASIGVAIYPRDGKTRELLIQHADAAMYEAKEGGKNQSCFFSKELERERKSHREIQAELSKAIKDNQLELFYQPKVFHPAEEGSTASEARIDGAEALIRWQHPEKGLISPSEFIHIAEQSDQIIDIGNWVLQAACKQLAIWQQGDLASLSIAVNLSPRQLRHPGLVSDMKELLKRYSINPAKLELELTESAIIENIDQSLLTLNKLKSLGVSLAMDDFGTGFSSLSYLKLLPIDVIKIDRSFIAGLPFDEDDAVIVRAIFSMARAMNLKVIAEGIESPLQAKYLQREGCLYSQGFLYSKPLSGTELASWVQNFKMPTEPRLQHS